MTLKQKFDSIDQSKLNSDQKDFLGKIEKATKNFTSDNKEVNDKVEGALDKMIATFKEKMPEVIKSKEAKKEPKATAKKASAKPSQTSSPKRTVMSVAKEIRKDGESWADAQKRAKAEINKDKKSAEKEVKTEMQKLMAFIKTRKELEGISGTDLGRDSVRQAKPRGRRISKDGNVYYENRENRIDRLAPNYPKDAPLLENGGDVGKKLYYERMNVGKAKYTVNYHDGVKTHRDGSAFYDLAIFKNKKDLQDFISKLSKEGYKERTSFYENGAYLTDPNFGAFQAGIYKKGGMLSPRERYNLEIKGMTGVSVGAIEKYIDENDLNDNDVLNIVVGLGRKQLKGADVSTAIVGKKGNAESKRLIRFVKDDKAMKMELGGNVGGYDLAGHLDGTFNVGQNDGDLSGVTGTSYSGLVGETGAMSSGEMFENGGDLSGFTGTQYSGLVGETGTMSSGEMFENGGDFQAGVYKNGGKITKSEVMANMYKPSGDYYLEPSGNDMIVHLTSRDAGNSIVSLENKFDVKDNGKGYHGSSYILSRKKYAEGGSLENHGIKEGDTFIKTISGGIQKVKDKDGKIVFINLATGERDSQPPLPFDDGGEVTYFVNKDGIRVRSVAKPDKELSEKEWMEKHSESNEARAYAEGGDIEAFSMRMVKGSGAKPTEVLTDEKSVKFAGGGSLREKRNEYLSKLGNKEADVWDKIGAQSGSQIRGDKKMLKAYAEAVEEMLIDENVQGRSFDQEDYDFYTDENWHLFNDFLVWNGYYKPEMTVVEKKWREKAFKEGNIYVSDPEVITVKGVSKKSDKKGYVQVTKTASRKYVVTVETPAGDWKRFNDTWKLDELDKAEKFAKRIAENHKVEYIGVDTTPYDAIHGKSKSKNYIVHADIKSVTVNQKGKVHTFKGSDVLNGANVLEKGNLLETKAIYIPKRDVVSVELKDGSEVKPSNGYWIKKDAKGEIFKPKSEKSESKFKVGDFVYNKRTKTIGVVRDIFDKGEVRTDADGVVNVSEITEYKEGNATHRKAKIAPSTQKELEKSVFETGGKVTFKQKANAIAKNFEGKRVEPEYQKEYGKTYDAKEAKEVGNKIAGAQKAKYDAKAEKGAVVKRKAGNPKFKQAMELAKKIRKDGEKWTDAVKRAYAQLK